MYAPTIYRVLGRWDLKTVSGRALSKLLRNVLYNLEDENRIVGQSLMKIFVPDWPLYLQNLDKHEHSR